MKDIKKVFKVSKRNYVPPPGLTINGRYITEAHTCNSTRPTGSIIIRAAFILKLTSRSLRFGISAFRSVSMQKRTALLYGIHRDPRRSLWRPDPQLERYELSKGTYSVCERNMPLNFKNLEDRLLEEFNRLRRLEPAIDDILARR